MKAKHESKKSIIDKGKVAFEGLKKREQNLIFTIVPLAIFIMFMLLLIEPEVQKYLRLSDSVSRLDTQLATSLVSKDELMEQLKVDPNTGISMQIDSLKKKLANLNQEFDGELSQLISPQAMPILLEQLFDRADNLTLNSMKSVNPEVLMVTKDNTGANTGDEEGKRSAQPIFMHGIEITFEGNFFATQEFLSQAELLGWKLYWQDLSYVVAEHPVAVTTLTLFTLSTSEAFIGVN